MNRTHWLGSLFLIVLMLAPKIHSFAQAADPIEHLWLNEEQTAKVQIFKATDGRFYGKIVWLKVPTIDGHIKIDINNPKPEHQNDPLLGLEILKGFKKDGDTGYEDGTVYDPKNGKTYDCKLTRDGNKLSVRGYVGFSMFGRTTTWTKAD